MIGFFSEKIYEIINVDFCLFFSEEDDNIIEIIRNWMEKYFILLVKKDGDFYK